MAEPIDPFLPLADDDHIRRERARARELRRSQWWKRRRANGKCHYCGETFPPKSLTMDHIVPIARGGRSTKGNVVPACKPCNAEKRYRLAWEIVKR
jgi:5-methylcytosine-specific restriction enzyme A